MKILVLLVLVTVATTTRAKKDRHDYFAGGPIPYYAKTYASSSSLSLLRGNATSRHLQTECTVPATLFSSDEVAESVAQWLVRGGASDTSLAEALVDIFVSDPSRLVAATGAQIRDLATDDFPDTCNRLPLNDDTCYVTLPKEEYTEDNFFEQFVADRIPFGREMLQAKEFVFEQLGEEADSATSFQPYSAVLGGITSLLPEDEDKGSCFVINPDMAGIAESPGTNDVISEGLTTDTVLFSGFPPPILYDICNCISLRTLNVPLCMVQPYLRGIAFSTGQNDPLRLDIAERLGEDFTLYDGLVQYQYVATGDIWIQYDFEASIPKIGSGNDDPKDGTFDPFDCIPSDGLEAVGLPDLPKITAKLSIFIDNNEPASSELVVLAAVEEVVLNLSILEVNLGSGVAALRLQSSTPECQPSGLFLSANVRLNMGAVGELASFLSGGNSVNTVEVDMGVTWKDDVAFGSGDFLQSVFLRLELNDFAVMGLNVDKAFVEVQYFDDKEFIRRRDFDLNVCCSLPGVSNCNVANLALAEWIARDDVSPQPTIGMFFGIQDLVFLGGGEWSMDVRYLLTHWKVVRLKKVNVEFIFQISQSDAALRFFLEADLQVLFLIDIKTLVLIEASDGKFLAAFEASISVNVGLGIGNTGIRASAEVTEYAYPAIDSGETSSGTSLINADWDLEFFATWETTEWLDDLAELIYEGLKAIGDALIAVWNGITMFVEAAWEAIKDLAAAIGGVIADVFDAIGEQVDQVNDGISAGIGFAVDILEGRGPVGDFAAGVLKGLDTTITFVLDTVGNVVDLSSSIFRGDWSAAGEAIVNLFGFSNSIRGKQVGLCSQVSPFPSECGNGLDATFGCPLHIATWEECKRAIFVPYDCRRKSQVFPDRACYETKAEQVELLKQDTKVADSQRRCRENSESRNQGIKWASESTVDEVGSSVAATMPTSNVELGKSSTLNPGGVCERLPFSVDVNALSTVTPGVTSTRLSSEGKTSKQCIDFESVETLEETFRNSGFQDDVAETARELSRGNQGLDKDQEVQSCNDIVVDQCVAPLLFEGAGFTKTASVACDVVASLSVEAIFGPVVPKIDSFCPSSSNAVEARLGQFDETADSCAPVSLDIERFARDCCNQKTNVIVNHLEVIPLPPSFIEAPGELDVELTCDSNIHPMGGNVMSPTFVPGCPDAVQSLDFFEEATFDMGTCMTTVKRTYVVTDDGCDALKSSYGQMILLRNDYNPEWDFFPDDKTIEVFEDYGPDNTGFPTAFQRCNANPIQLTFYDTIEDGECFAQKVLTRTFVAVDICGHSTSRSQRITIENKLDALPFGRKSLSSIYGRERAQLGSDTSQCLWSSQECGVFESPTDYVCSSGEYDEFDSYQAFLSSLDASRSLDLGTVKLECNCPPYQMDCDKRAQEGGDYMISVLYGAQVVTKAGACTVLETRATGTNSGIETQSTKQGFDCPALTRGQQRRVECTIIQLTGWDTVYNVFAITASEMADSTIEIDAPSSSIILINVLGDPMQDLTVTSTSAGVLLGPNMIANNLIWNMPQGVHFLLNGANRPAYQFSGTLLNGLGSVDLLVPSNVEQTWTGQMFANSLHSNGGINFECGHFAGFATCEVTVPMFR